MRASYGRAEYFGVLGDKHLVTVTAIAVIAFGIGFFLGARRTELTPTQAAPAVTNTAALREEAERLKSEVERFTSDLYQLQADNVRLTIERTNRRPIRARQIFGAALERHEIQSLVVHNLRQLMAARDQYHFEHGRPPLSISDLVGANRYFTHLYNVDGEDYLSLPLGADANFLVTTGSGITIGYHGGGAPMSDEHVRIDWPPEITRYRELREKVAGTKQTAREAYRAANHGKEPPQDRALLPYFSTPQQGADFVEYLDAHKAARDKFDTANFK